MEISNCYWYGFPLAMFVMFQETTDFSTVKKVRNSLSWICLKVGYLRMGLVFLVEMDTRKTLVLFDFQAHPIFGNIHWMMRDMQSRTWSQEDGPLPIHPFLIFEDLWTDKLKSQV